MITIVDYGMGNVASISNMLRKVGCPSRVTSHAGDIAGARKLILPGVGSFDTGMRSLRERGLLEPIRERAGIDRVPLLGICLGMQLLANTSEEGTLPGLGLVDATVVRFPGTANGKALKVPHMGWNVIEPRKPSALLEGLPPSPRFYFVHAYHLRLVRGEDLLAETVYGQSFPSAIEAGNLLGVQFHPEKSHTFGLRLLKNFVDRY